MITRLDDDLHARAKRRAEALGLTLNDLVVDAIERELSVAGDPRADVRRRAEALGVAAAPARRRLAAGPSTRDEAIEALRGSGRSVSEALEWARG